MSPRAELALLRPPAGHDTRVVPESREWRRRAACRDHAPGWDLDLGTLADWRRARATCRACPVLAQCRAALLELYPLAGESTDLDRTPISVTWAGVSFGPTGRVLDDRALRSMWTRAQNEQQTAAAGGAAA